MSDSPNERRVYALPPDLVERIRSFQQSQNISSETEAVRRLLDSALAMRDSIHDVLYKLKARYKDEPDLRVLAKDLLVGHPKVSSVSFEAGAAIFAFADGDFGKIDNKGFIYSGDRPDYMSEVVPPVRPRLSAPSRGSPPKSASDLDDDIPF